MPMVAQAQQQQPRSSSPVANNPGAAAARRRPPPPSAVRGWTALNAGPVAPPRFRPDSVLPLVSSAVEASAQIATFESFAGRSAMGELVCFCGSDLNR